MEVGPHSPRQRGHLPELLKTSLSTARTGKFLQFACEGVWDASASRWNDADDTNEYVYEQCLPKHTWYTFMKG